MAGPLSAQSVLVSPVQYVIILIPGSLAHLNLYAPDTRTKPTQNNPKPLTVVFFIHGGRLGWLICVQTSRTPLYYCGTSSYEPGILRVRPQEAE